MDGGPPGAGLAGGVRALARAVRGPAPGEQQRAHRGGDGDRRPHRASDPSRARAPRCRSAGDGPAPTLTDLMTRPLLTGEELNAGELAALLGRAAELKRAPRSSSALA